MNIETIWLIAGLIMVIADLLFGTFFILFVGAAALITGMLIWMGILPDPTWQWVVFAVVSTLGLVLFRKKLVQIFGKGSGDLYQEHRGQKVQVIETIPVNGKGRVNYKGADWYAKSNDEQPIEAGDTAVVQQLDGIVLIVTKA
ncbi:MAG: NfeD family protein [Bacteroidia bacterium]|nr:NfeD family protein [Bacteroidia bacterium]